MHYIFWVISLPLLINIHLRTYKSGYLPPFTGGLVRGFLLDVIRKNNPKLASELHKPHATRPFSIKPLRPKNKKMVVIHGGWKIEENDLLIFSIGILDDSLEAEIFNHIIDQETVTFSKLSFSVEKIEVRRKKYRDLLKALYNRRIGIEFKTPTIFSMKGTNIEYLFPEPSRFFGSLISLWNTFAPRDLVLPEKSLMDWIKEAIRVKSYNLKTREVPIENVKITGFKGTIEYVVIEGREQGLEMLSPLLEFVQFSNVGIKRAYGLGSVIVTDLTKKPKETNKAQ